MRDNSLEIRQEYYAAINGNITLGGVDVPLYDVVQANRNAPYIYFFEFSSVDTSDKTGFSTIVVVGLVVVTKYETSFGGAKDSDDITNQILQILLPQNRAYFSSTNFKIITSTLTGNIIQKQSTNSGTIIRRIIRVEHFIEQTTSG